MGELIHFLPLKRGGLIRGRIYFRAELNRGFTVDSSMVETVTTIIRVAQSRVTL